VNERVERLRAAVDGLPFLVTDPINVQYLTGFHSTNPALLVEPDRVRLFSDFRYAELGRAVPGVEFVETTRFLAPALAQLLSGRIGFEADVLTYADWETLRDGGLELVPRTQVVKQLRAVKDDEEVDVIRRATAITNEAYERLARERFVGRTEREVARRLNEIFEELGADDLAFPSIVASGPQSARPHTEPGPRTIEAGETVIVDAGAKLGGYHSDCTRTFATGPLPDDLQRAYDATLRAQLAGLDAVRPGVTGVDADRAARAVIEAQGLGDSFGHGLGHGVGLQIHEAPILSTLSTDTVAVGNAVTVEPGIYLSGRGGVRIEDLVIVRDGAPEILTTFTKELVQVS
jgi:Xaa-Pro aminopeptidase